MPAALLLALTLHPLASRSDDSAHAAAHRDGVSSLDSDRYRALEPGPEGSIAIAHVLADYHRRSDGEAGFAWWMKLPIAVRSRQATHGEARRWRNRIEFLRDAQRHDAVSCAISGRPVLDDPELGCDYVEELDRYLGCTATLPPERRDEIARTVLADSADKRRAAQQACAGEAGAPAVVSPPGAVPR